MNCILFYKHSKSPGVYKPAGPFRLATELRKAGFSVQCIDAATGDEELLNKIIDKFVTSETLWVGISTTFTNEMFGLNFNRAAEIRDTDDTQKLEALIARCKSKSPNVRFISGGAHYMNLSRFGFYHIRGYADTEIVEFTRWCKDSSYSPKLQRLGKMITGTEYRDFVTSKIVWEKNDLLTPEEFLPIEVSRGCIFRCKFCAYPLNGKTKGEWVKHYDVLKEELIYNYENFGIASYNILDDTYNDDTSKVIGLYENVFSKLSFKLDITSYIRLDLMMRFPEQAAVLRDSGWKSIILGIETNNSRSAKAIGKGVDFQKQMEYIRQVKQNEMSDTLIQSGFIFGLPYDDDQSMDELRDFLLSSENPLDDWHVKSLALNPVDRTVHKKYFSEFDLEYEKYGYEILDTNAFYGINWRLKNGLTRDYCSEKAEAINMASRVLPNYKYGSADYCRMSTIMPREEVRTLSRRELYYKYNTFALETKRMQRYYERLLSI